MDGAAGQMQWPSLVVEDERDMFLRPSPANHDALQALSSCEDGAESHWRGAHLLTCVTQLVIFRQRFGVVPVDLLKFREKVD